MTVSDTRRGAMPVRVDELLRGDRIIFLDAIVEVLDVVERLDFPTALSLTVRRWNPEAIPGRPAATLLPRGHLVTAVWLPRHFDLRCMLCRAPMPTRANLAEGTPRRALCGTCANPVGDRTVLLPRTRSPQ
jgi:hypothetical protein